MADHEKGLVSDSHSCDRLFCRRTACDCLISWALCWLLPLLLLITAIIISSVRPLMESSSWKLEYECQRLEETIRNLRNLGKPTAATGAYDAQNNPTSTARLAVRVLALFSHSHSTTSAAQEGTIWFKSVKVPALKSTWPQMRQWIAFLLEQFVLFDEESKGPTIVAGIDFRNSTLEVTGSILGLAIAQIPGASTSLHALVSRVWFRLLKHGDSYMDQTISIDDWNILYSSLDWTSTRGNPICQGPVLDDNTIPVFAPFLSNRAARICTLPQKAIDGLGVFTNLMGHFRELPDSKPRLHELITPMTRCLRALLTKWKHSDIDSSEEIQIVQKTAGNILTHLLRLSMTQVRWLVEALDAGVLKVVLDAKPMFFMRVPGQPITCGVLRQAIVDITNNLFKIIACMLLNPKVLRAFSRAVC